MATLPKAYALFETTLQDSITSAGTSMTLVTGTDKEGTNLAGTIGYIIDEGTASEEFVIGATTATAVTSMARGVSSSDGTTEVAENKKAHRKGASIKITNHPLLIRLYRIANGDDAFPDNAQTLGDGSLLASSAAPTSDAMIANKKYIDDTAIAGGAKATEVIYGISKLSVAADSAVAPIAVGDNDNRVPTVDTSTVTADMVAALAGTGTPNGTTGKYVTLDSATATPTASKIPIADGSGKLDGGWLGVDTAGDIIYSDGTDLQKLGIGTGGQVLQTNAGATAPEWGLPFATGQTTRLTDASTGSQNIAHGLGRIPNGVIIQAYRVTLNGATDDVAESYGTATSITTETCSYMAIQLGSGNGKSIGQNASAIIDLQNSAGTAVSVATLSTLDATNITLNFTTHSDSGAVLMIQWSVY